MLLSVLLSCKLDVPDVPICVEINPSKAFCTYTMSNRDFYWSDDFLYDGKTYWDSRPLLIHLPPQSWAKIKAFILKMCHQSGDCTQSTEKEIMHFLDRQDYKSPLSCFGTECEGRD